MLYSASALCTMYIIIKCTIHKKC